MDNRQNAFERLVAEQKSTIYSVCYMFADSRDDADDLFQEVLVNLWQGLVQFRGDSSVRTWVYRVSLNTCINFERKTKRRNQTEAHINPSIFAADTEVGAQTAMLHRRIQQLDIFDRAIVMLWLENMSYDEIGSIVGLSPKSVGVRLVRIREKLKAMK